MSEPPEELPATEPTERPPQRLRLLEALYGVDEGLGAMYEGATRMIDDPDFPDSLSLGAHAMRELMEKLPRVLDVPAGKDFSLSGRINEIEEIAKAARTNSSCATTNGWEGEIDAPAAKVLNEVEALIADRARDRLSRSEAARELMKHLEPGSIRRSEMLTRAETKAWMMRREYFEAVAHHGHVYSTKMTSHAEFAENVRAVESVLLDKLRPQTAADFEDIDRLMAAFEGEE